MTIKGIDNAISAIDGMFMDVNKKVKLDYIQTLTAIVNITPVHFKDGGRLRNSWTLSTGAPRGVERNASKNGSSSLNSVDKMPKYVLDKKLYFTNPMPYANVVEYGGFPNPPQLGTNVSESGEPQYQRLSSGGYSLQAPHGMVRVNVRRLRKALKRRDRAK